MLEPIERDLREEKRTPAEICARYLLLHLHRRHPAQWLSSPRKDDRPVSEGRGLIEELASLSVSVSPKQRERLQMLTDSTELLRRFFFRGVVLDSHEGLVGWLDGRYPLSLRLDVPTPEEMLGIQCEGKRFVSLILGHQFIKYGRHADACDFLLHDFEHAHKFFGNKRSFRGQRQFFRALRRSLTYFARWMTDPGFVKDLEYLKSDMNSHPVHLMKYLKAIVLSAEMRQSGLRHPPLDEFWSELFSGWGMPGKTLDSALRINQPEGETPQDLVAVAEFFMPSSPEIACEPAQMDAR